MATWELCAGWTRPVAVALTFAVRDPILDGLAGKEPGNTPDPQTGQTKHTEDDSVFSTRSPATVILQPTRGMRGLASASSQIKFSTY